MPIEFNTDPSASGFDASNLGDVRAKFIKASRRYDLVASGNPAGADNGANDYINAAQRYLDRKVTVPQQVRRHHALLETNAYSITFPHLLRLDSLTLIDPTDERTDITEYRKTRRELKYLYPQRAEDLDAGTPEYWAFNVLGLSPALFGSTEAELVAAELVDIEDLHFNATTPDFAYQGIIFGVKAEQDFNVEIEGKFYSAYLDADTDVSIWTVSHPELLVIAACYILERQMKNASGMRAWKEALEDELFDLDSDSVEHELEGLDLSMEG